MLRRLGTLLGTLLVTATVGVTVPAAPAAARTGVCVAQGIMTTGPLNYPGFQPGGTLGILEVPPTADTVGYSFHMYTGACAYLDPAIETALSGSGVITGWCDTSTGTGGFAPYYQFNHTSVGSFWIIAPPSPVPATPSAVGLAQVLVEFTNGQSCIQGSTLFLVTGAWALL